MEEYLELKPSLVYSSAEFLENYSSGSHEEYIEATIKHYKIRDVINFLSRIDLFTKESSSKIPSPYEHKITFFQLIIFSYLKKYRPSWLNRFKKGLINFEGFEQDNMDIYQCLFECGIFKEKLANKDIFFCDLCSVLSRVEELNESFENALKLTQIGTKGELCSFYLLSNEVTEPKMLCKEDNDLGYDLELDLITNKAFIEVKSSVSSIDKAIAHVSRNQINTFIRTEEAGINDFFFHFWSFYDEKANLAIIKPSDIKELFAKEPEGVKIPIQEIAFNNFHHLFKEIDIKGYDL